MKGLPKMADNLEIRRVNLIHRQWRYSEAPHRQLH